VLIYLEVVGRNVGIKGRRWPFDEADTLWKELVEAEKGNVLALLEAVEVDCNTKRQRRGHESERPDGNSRKRLW
jgi:hypothetical protein